MVVVTVCMLGAFGVLELTDAISLYKRTDVFFLIFSFWIGMLFWEYRDKCKNIIVTVCSLLICIFLAMVDVTAYLSDIAIMHIFGVAVFTVLYNIPIEKVQNKEIVRDIIIFFSKYSYSVMLVHHVLIYWGIKACSIIGLNLNLGLFIIIAGIYVVAYIFDRMVKWMMKKIKVGNRIGKKR